MQDRALPIAVKRNDAHTRLRLYNKLTELMLNLRLYGQAVEFAQSALDISKSLGMNICHKVHNLLCYYSDFNFWLHKVFIKSMISSK